MLWRNLILRMTHLQGRISNYCCHSKVEVLLKQGSGSDLGSTVSGTEDCSELLSMRDFQWLPGANEWILVDYSQTSEYTEVVRARLPFIHYIISNLDVSSRVQLERPGKCFLCRARILWRQQERIVIHSFLEDATTSVEIIVKDVGDSPQLVDPVPAISMPAPQSSSRPRPAPKPRKRRKTRKCTQVIW